MGEKTNSLLFMVRYNGNMYTYLKNLQGDIVGIVDSNGNLVVEYRYDAWGKPLSKTGSLASTLGTLNPFRYRGYVYDEETGLYYLRSRLFSPDNFQFISPDILRDANTELMQNNLYCYCLNNPYVLEDSERRFGICFLGFAFSYLASKIAEAISSIFENSTLRYFFTFYLECLNLNMEME